ncbi:MAG: bile acid:sodium symporter family protein [Myxococcota bacterium]|nr:bile acid:sodium symporter family protein [Myxococcota bacterium]
MLERYFLAIAIAFSIAALGYPEPFAASKGAIPYLLGVIMFGMGLTLEWRDFLQVWRLRRLVVLGLVAQFTVMPLVALALGHLFGVPNDILVGLIIVGACPGGTASNVIAYLAKANVALSVTMTLASTALAPFVTPLLIHTLAGELVEVPFLAMVQSVFWIVVFPLVDGLLIRQLFQKRLTPLLKVFPSVSIVAISVVIAIVMALNQATILHFPLLIGLAVILHNVTGLAAGYGLGWLLRCDERDRRTLAIEVGMQNSGLGASLATSFFSPLAALPSALFSLWHNLSGIALAQRWGHNSPGHKSNASP